MSLNNKKWRLIILKDLDPIRVQAIYHALALSISNTPDTNAVLLTTINKSSISCGHHQNFYEEVDIDYCEKNNIALVRRLAGGGLVLLEKDQVFYNVILNGFGFPSPIKNLFSISLRGPNQFLRNLNLNSSIDYNEVLVNNKKISGNGAASIEKTGVVAGNILLDFNYDKFCDALNVPSNNFKKLIREKLKKHITTLRREVNRPIAFDETIKGLRSAFEASFKIKFVEDDLNDSEKEKLKEVEDEYRQITWNFRKKDEKNKIRSYIKIKKGTCIVHYAPYRADFFISNEILKKVLIDNQKKELKKLIGMNIHKIRDEYPEYANLQNILAKFFNLSNV